jgi:putative transposase
MKLVLERRPTGLLVSRACAAVGLSRSSFYACLRSEPKTFELDPEVARVCESYPCYGYRRSAHQLRAEGFEVGVKAVRSSMKRQGLLAKRRIQKKRTTFPVAIDAENLLLGLTVCAPGAVLAADATWIPFGRGRGLYMAVVLDLFTRQALGYALGTRLDSKLTADALAKAVKRSLPRPGWVHHSDRGSTYASNEYRACVSAASGRCSFTSPGKPQQNGAVESFFKTIKHEELLRNEYDDPAALVKAVETFIRFYNGSRLHSSLGYKAPDQFAEAIHSRN